MKKRVFRLTFFNFMLNVGIPLFSLIDIVVISSLSSNDGVPAVALGGIYFTLLLFLFNFIRISTEGALTAAKESKNVVFQALSFYFPLLIMFFVGLILLAVNTPLMTFLSELFDNSETLTILSVDYCNVRAFELPFAFMNLVIVGWLSAQNETKTVLRMISLELILNIVVSYLLVLYFDMGVEGVALGTVIARFVAFAYGIVYMFVNYRKVLVQPGLIKHFKCKNIRRSFDMKIELFVRVLCLIFAFFVFVYYSSTLGEATVIVNSIFVQIFMVYVFFMDGMAFSVEKISSVFISGKKFSFLQNYLSKVLFHASIIAFIFSLVFMFCGDLLLSAFADYVMLKMQASAFQVFVVILPIASFVAFVWEGLFASMSKLSTLKNISLVSTFLIFMPSLLILKYFDVTFYLWLSLLILFVSRSVLVYIFKPKISES